MVAMFQKQLRSKQEATVPPLSPTQRATQPPPPNSQADLAIKAELATARRNIEEKDELIGILRSTVASAMQERDAAITQLEARPSEVSSSANVEQGTADVAGAVDVADVAEVDSPMWRRTGQGR